MSVARAQSSIRRTATDLLDELVKLGLALLLELLGLVDDLLGHCGTARAMTVNAGSSEG